MRYECEITYTARTLFAVDAPNANKALVEAQRQHGQGMDPTETTMAFSVQKGVDGMTEGGDAEQTKPTA